MKIWNTAFLILLSLLMIQAIVAQEEEKIDVEESAEVFLEEYTDEFQEAFFEALKQKGIQNYDRASNLLLKCKLLRPDDSAIDHELAKVNLLDKKYIIAEQYGVKALISEPENFWYLNTLNTILERQGNTLDMKRESIPLDNPSLQENLAQIYFLNQRYEAALKVAEGMKKTKTTEELILKINDSLHKANTFAREQALSSNKTVVTGETSNPVKKTRFEIETAISNSQFEQVLKLANEAVESYPLQPYFYYALGLAHNSSNNHSEAIEVLESGLDYLFDDDQLANRFYKELATAHKALGNVTKANEYLAKSKSGS